MSRDDLDAVIVALPIVIQPNIIRQALEAGKHVLSEKPIAKDCETASQLLHWYRAQPSLPLWAVGENFRYMDFVTCAATRLSQVGGSILSFSMSLHTMIEDDNKFYNSDWRKTPEYQGGFLLDGGVHFVAGIRALLQALGESVESVSCVSSLLQEKLAPVDTLQSIWRLKSGRAGCFVCSFGTVHKAGLTIEVVTEKGCVTATPSGVTVKVDGVSEEIEIEAGSGVVAELEAFRNSVASDSPDSRQLPEEAYADLQILEAMLRSGEQGAAVKHITK